MIKAIIFDFDGLMVDTESPAYDAFCEVYGEYGQHLPLELYAKCVGTSFDAFNPYAHLSELLDHKVDENTIREKVNESYAKLLQGVTPRPGVVDYLNTAKEMGLKIGLASSSYYEWIEPYFTKFNLKHYFDSICTADNVKQVKPDPELYQLSLHKLNIEADQAIVFEDSLNGMRAAQSAGIKCVLVPNEMTRHFPFGDVDVMINSMDEIGLQKVIDKCIHSN